MALPEQLERARALSRYSQVDVAAALGVSRVMVSYWESGKRRPSDRQLVALVRLYRVEPSDLLAEEPLEPRPDTAQMLFRSADMELSPHARSGLEDFIRFLDVYAELSQAMAFPIRGMRQSPFGLVQGFESVEDARRKAEEVRAHLRLGLGPIGDLDRVCELLGITVYRAALGTDLTKTISGAFFNHSEVGFSVLVNLEMTPGRQRFTFAHEFAHALFHSDRGRFVVSGPKRTPAERFADAFAGEFLMPTEGVRRVMEEYGLGPRIRDAAEVVYLQRFFQVSYPTALVRLRQARLLTQRQFDQFRHVRPVLFAMDLGYEVSEEEFAPDVDRWRIRRFPPRFLRLLCEALVQGRLSVASAANLTGLSIDEVEELLEEEDIEGPPWETEFNEFEATVLSA
ncbi:MAG TPA: XRE family transcriptional regulator [Actinomycetota bacterium]|nr:XRE family transcriptional regulator [Actinomycetota bacterium]